MRRKTWAVMGTLALTAAITASLTLNLVVQAPEAEAADHLDPAPRAMGPGDSGDIGDLYVWHRGTGASQTLVAVLTFAGPAAPIAGQTGTYDKDALYTIHIDNDDADNLPNHNIYVRYGQNPQGEWGVQVIGMPGEAGPVVGPVETSINGTSGKVWTGLADDPFFFDLTGFQQTLQTGTLAFDNTRDFFAGNNITAIVLEMPMAATLVGGSKVNVWATTAKK